MTMICFALLHGQHINILYLRELLVNDGVCVCENLGCIWFLNAASVVCIML